MGRQERSIEIETGEVKAADVATAEGRGAAAPATGAYTAIADDPASSVLTGYPGVRLPHDATGGQAADDPAAGVLTGYPGDRATGRVDIRERNVEPSRPTPQEAKGGRGHE